MIFAGRKNKKPLKRQASGVGLQTLVATWFLKRNAPQGLPALGNNNHRSI
jgi:hypothetical protein